MSASIAESPLPNDALLQRFVASGDYTDCFVTRIDTAVTFPAYVEAFYTTGVFKAERLVLRWLASLPSTDSGARALANNESSEFAAWKTLDREDNQLLLMDVRGRTCSWFMLLPDEGGSRLYFGSAVIKSRKTSSGRRMAWTFRSLLGAHRLYSRMLLRAARARLTDAANR